MSGRDRIRCDANLIIASAPTDDALVFEAYANVSLRDFQPSGALVADRIIAMACDRLHSNHRETLGGKYRLARRQLRRSRPEFRFAGWCDVALLICSGDR